MVSCRCSPQKAKSIKIVKQLEAFPHISMEFTMEFTIRIVL